MQRKQRLQKMHKIGKILGEQRRQRIIRMQRNAKK